MTHVILSHPSLSQLPVRRQTSGQRSTATRGRPRWRGTRATELCRTCWRPPPPPRATTSPVTPPTTPPATWKGCAAARATPCGSKPWDGRAAPSVTWRNSWSPVSDDTWAKLCCVHAYMYIYNLTPRCVEFENVWLRYSSQFFSINESPKSNVIKTEYFSTFF